jgi:putative aldouronate transport system permease protein
MSNVGMTAAAGMYQSVVGLILVLVVNWIVTKIDPDSAMF